MPTEYKRKCADRGKWSTNQLEQALEAVNNGRMGINVASRAFAIPSWTLRRRRDQHKSQEVAMGPSSLFGKENEKKLVKHIQKLQAKGFAPTRDDLRRIAFKFAVSLDIQHPFNPAKGMAGYDWMNSFLRRYPELSIRKSEGVSLARAECMSKQRVIEYFELLRTTLEEYNLIDKPGHVYNMDETGLQLKGIVFQSLRQGFSAGSRRYQLNTIELGGRSSKTLLLSNPRSVGFSMMTV